MPWTRQITTIYVDRQVEGFAQTAQVIESLPHALVEKVDGPSAIHSKIRHEADSAGAGKKILYLCQNKGRFLRPCPGTSHYSCCGYTIAHIGTYCPMDCAYCVLQAYFHPPILSFFVNHDELFTQLDEFFCQKPKDMRRVGTGEFTDSLVWDSVSDLSARLVERFASQNHAVLELKTKTAFVDRILGLSHNRKTIVAFSVNTPKVIKEQERSTASLAARLAAAKKCQENGYPLAFHFDPLVIYPGCEAEYVKVVEQIFDAVSPKNTVWISLGAFRCMPDLLAIIRQRFPASKLPYGELIPGLDGKMRYFKPLRIALFEVLIKAIKDIAPGVTAYFCMEDEPAWKKCFGFSPSQKGGIAAMLDEAAQRVCGIEGNGNR